MENPDDSEEREMNMAFAYRFLCGEAETVKRHYKMKDLSHTTASDMLKASVLEARGLFLAKYPDVTLTATLDKRGNTSVNIS
jgi:hypothetical protein